MGCHLRRKVGFRDTFAVTLLEDGVPIREVSRALAHTSVTTTERHYAKWTPDQQVRLDEYAEVLARAELRIRRGLRQQLLQLIKNNCYTVAPTRRLEVTSDPDDNIFLE